MIQQKILKKFLAQLTIAGARLICGAFRTSRISNILCEANKCLPTLERRLRNLTVKYALKTISNPVNPFKKLSKVLKINSLLTKKLDFQNILP